MKNANIKQTTRAISEAAICVAAALALSFLKLKLWVNGGSVDLVMVPLLILAFRRGAGWGMGAGLVFGTLKCFLAGGYAWSWASILLDYSVAYMAVGLAGVFRGRSLAAGTVFGGFCRFIVHFASGITIYAVSIGSPGNLFGHTYTNAWLFSLLYNGSYMLVNTVLALAAIRLLQRPLRRYLQ